MARVQKLNPTTIDSLKSGKMTDPENPGLTIEVLGSGKKTWKYARRLNVATVVRASLGTYPAKSIAAARTWAREMNDQVEAGIDPRETERAKADQDAMTVNDAHLLYMAAVARNEHKTNRKNMNRPLKPRSVIEKQAMYDRNVKPVLGSRPLTGVTQDDLVKIIVDMGSRSKVQANRTAAELKVFFNWTLSLRARAHDFKMKDNPASVLGELRYAENERTRWLDHDELPIFLQALAQEEELHHRRALLLLLLTGTRKRELVEAPSIEFNNGLWVLPAARAKNHEEHPMQLGPWGCSLMTTNSKWIIASPKLEDGPMANGWEKVCLRVENRMSKIAGRTIEHWTLHDLRRTMRSHIDDLVDEAVAERMINHKPGGLVARYNRNKRAAAMADGFAKWEATLAAMAIKAGVGDALGVTTTVGLPSTPEPHSA